MARQLSTTAARQTELPSAASSASFASFTDPAPSSSTSRLPAQPAATSSARPATPYMSTKLALVRGKDVRLGHAGAEQQSRGFRSGRYDHPTDEWQPVSEGLVRLGTLCGGSVVRKSQDLLRDSYAIVLFMNQASPFSDLSADFRRKIPFVCRRVNVSLHVFACFEFDEIRRRVLAAGGCYASLRARVVYANTHLISPSLHSLAYWPAPPSFLASLLLQFVWGGTSHYYAVQKDTVFLQVEQGGLGLLNPVDLDHANSLAFLDSIYMATPSLYLDLALASRNRTLRPQQPDSSSPSSSSPAWSPWTRLLPPSPSSASLTASPPPPLAALSSPAAQSSHYTHDSSRTCPKPSHRRRPLDFGAGFVLQIAEDDCCIFCGLCDSLIHALFDCDFSSSYWSALVSLLAHSINDYMTTTTLAPDELLLGLPTLSAVTDVSSSPLLRAIVAIGFQNARRHSLGSHSADKPHSDVAVRRYAGKSRLRSHRRPPRVGFLSDPGGSFALLSPSLSSSRYSLSGLSVLRL
ncbi:hypothetical protein NBRC10512_005361 [Rhodotorula toruloides]